MAERYTEDERMAQIVAVHELLAQNRSYRYIADRLEISTSTVHDRAQEAVKVAGFAVGSKLKDQHRTEQATSVRLWLSRVEDDYVAGQSSVHEAVKSLVPLWTRLSKLLGLDAPATVQITDQRDETPPDPELVAMIREAAAKGDRTLALNEDPANDGAERY